MTALKQQGSLKEYFIEYKKLANQLDDMSETDKVINFIEGLKTSTAAHIRYKQKSTIEEAYEEAEKYEAFSQETKITNSSTNNEVKRDQHWSGREYYCAFCRRHGHSTERCRARR